MSDGHLVIASGGTGGHFYPTLAVAREFLKERPSGKVTLLVSGKHAEEQTKIAADFGIEAIEIPSVRLPGASLAALAFPFRMLSCVMSAKKVLKRLEADVLLGMGSFAAVPACWAVNTKKTPLVLHEGNSFMGLTNRVFIRKASAIGLSLPLADMGQVRGRRSEQVGMPLREAIVEAAAGSCEKSPDYLPSLGLSNDKKTVLVFGGSQGARAVNELFAKTASLLGDVKDWIQFMHLTGSDDNAALENAYKEAGVAASIRRADSSIEKCYIAADLVICRSGASSICELSLFGKPLVLIPLPTAADDHQTVNAKVLEAAGAARHFPQKEATPEKLSSLLKDFLANGAEWNAMGEKLRQFGKPQAAANLVHLILSVMK
ncbi:MAG: UDP-N-acetylglucosamine--N-acetylmuramyl-(pentapeptide) pyrophosphoryl-undecaprenol N-acetylglucosamine transferase [Victivallales bacterium]|nr:UDP-N-acetylglucosamine--N-acetylmuramyl-(pentapeptide) pyrophosphoryl-undecaprenol N-acetylglucosamine transferase [Victivallales bacterium]